MVLLGLGFPVAIIFSWIFDFTSEGIRKTKALELTKKNGKGHSDSEGISKFKGSIAVLPFQDMSPQKDQEYFCEGISEEIINALTRIESLKVIARTSAFAFKGNAMDIRDIGKALNVEASVVIGFDTAVRAVDGDDDA